MPFWQSTESAPDEMMVGSALAPHSSATANKNIAILFIVFCKRQIDNIITFSFSFARSCPAPAARQAMCLWAKTLSSLRNQVG
jgi:hypothetical protein